MPEKKFFRYVLPYMQSNMYLCIEQEQALIVDPHISFEALDTLRTAGVKQLLILLTHEHFDHTSGVNFFRSQCQEVYVIGHAETALHIIKPRNNRPLALLKMVTAKNRVQMMEEYHSYPVLPITVDHALSFEEAFAWKGHRLQFRFAPGHSRGSMLIHFDEEIVFTGDYMIADTAVILRYPGSSVLDYQQKTLPILLHLSQNSCIFPGHGIPYRLLDADYREGIFCLRAGQEDSDILSRSGKSGAGTEGRVHQNGVEE